MKVKTEFITETEDYEESAFKKEILALLEDIDPNIELLTFKMTRVTDHSK